MDEEIQCPRCGGMTSVEIEDYGDGSLEIECDSCEATLEVSYSVSIHIDDVSVGSVPPVEIECPECGCFTLLDDIDDESGSQEVECECEATLEVSWSNWGRDVNAQVIEGSDDDDDDDEDDEDDDDDDDEDW